MKYLDYNGTKTLIDETKGLINGSGYLQPKALSKVIDCAHGGTSTVESTLERFGSVIDTKVTNYLVHKRVNIIGDSITAGADGTNSGTTTVTRTFPSYLEIQYFCQKVNNYGIGASTLSNYQGEAMFPPNPMCNRINSIDKTADITVIFGGTNDFGYQVEPGDCGNGDDTTVIGALYQMITWIKTNCPKQEIVLCSPMRRANSTMAKINGKYPLIDYVKAVESAAKRFGVNYINLYDGCPFDLSDTNQNDRYGGDGLHPNQQGYYLLADYIGYKLATQSFDMPRGGSFTTLYNDAPPTSEQNLPIYYFRCWKDYPMIEAAATAFGNVIAPVTFNTTGGTNYVAPLRNYDGTLVGTCYFYCSGTNRGQIRYVPAASWGGSIRIVGYDI